MRVFSVVGMTTAGALMALSSYVDPRQLCSHLVLGCAVFLFLPVVMSAALGLVSVPLAVVIVALALLLSPNRRSGAGELIAELFAIVFHVVPGYVAALRRVRSPRVWGFVVGAFVATAMLIADLWPGAPS